MLINKYPIHYIFLIISFLLLFTTVTSIHFPKLFPFFSYKDLEINYYTLVSKKITDKSFQFLLHYPHTVHYGKAKKPLDIAEYLTFEVFLIEKNMIQFIFRDANTTKFELPCEEPFPCHKYSYQKILDFNMNNLNSSYDILIKERPFSFTLIRKTTREIIFTTMNRQISIKDNYAEISTDLPSENLFGLGERSTQFKLKSGTYTLYNKDLYGELEDGSGYGKNRYGSHPMYLMREASGNYHVSYLRNSFPMDIIVNHLNSVLTYKIAGGILDFTFFLGDLNPETAIKMYHNFLGGYSLPPFWAMGFHQCRWGYKNLNMIKDVLINYEKNKLPLDAIWSDIDYMEDYMPFTVDKYRFDLDDFKYTLKQYRKKYVMISEPSMGTKWPNYEFLVKGKNAGIFIKNKNGGYILNKVWPGKCHFIDYFNPASKDYWNEAMISLHDKLEYNGVWLDMNEIAAFNPGQMDMWDNTLSCEDSTNYPYIPGGKPLETATICPNAIHYGNRQHVELHNYYPNQQSKLTYELLEKLYPDNFPFILTRANAPGIGKYAAHWSGDNYGRFDFYKLSISEVLNFNLFGAPMVGADICGFGDNTPEHLCAKWYQMGSLYPFSRSHAHLDSYRKEPFAMGNILLETTLKSLRFRYSILKYYYSLFMLNKNTGGTIFRPIFFEFYEDLNCLEDSSIDNFFMIGSSLLAIPNLHDDDNTIKTPAYFPKGQWFDLRDNSRVNKRSIDPQIVNVETRLYEMPAVFLRSGKTIFTNEIENVSNTYDLDNNFNILIGLEQEVQENKYTSQGMIPALFDYQSKNKVENCINRNCFVNILTTYENNSLKINFQKSQFYDTDYQPIGIKSIVVFGVNLGSGVTVQSTNLENFLQIPKGIPVIPSEIPEVISPKYEIIYINEYCLKIKINDDLKLKQSEEMNLYFELKIKQ